MGLAIHRCNEPNSMQEKIMSEVTPLANLVKNREAREDALVAFFQENPQLLESDLQQLSSRKLKKGDLASLFFELLEAVKKGRPAPKPAPEAKPKPKPATERVVKAAFPGIRAKLLMKIVSMATMSREGLVVKFAEESHREWFDKRPGRNPNLTYVSEGVTITVTKKKK